MISKVDSSGSSSDWYPELAPNDVPEEALGRDGGMSTSIVRKKANGKRNKCQQLRLTCSRGEGWGEALGIGVKLRV